MMKPSYTIFFILLLLLTSCQAQEEESKNVLLLSGKKTHGYGHHECNSDITVLAGLLEKQTKAKFRTKIFLDGKWPEDKELENADALVIICDGDKKHLLTKRMDEFDALLKKNKDLGLLFVHYATVPPGRNGKYFDKWIGGYYSGETGAKTLTRFSYIQAKLPEHPVNNGVKPYRIFDEIYYKMSYVKDIKPIVIAASLDKEPTFTKLASKRSVESEKKRFKSDNHQVATFKTEKERTIFWSFERESGGKSLGVTMGHIHRNFWRNESIRKQMINSVAWISGLEVPKDGLDPLEITEEELYKNHSKP